MCVCVCVCVCIGLDRETHTTKVCGVISADISTHQSSTHTLANHYSLSKLSWRDRKHGRKGIHLMKNGSNKRHVIMMGVNALPHASLVRVRVENSEGWSFSKGLLYF